MGTILRANSTLTQQKEVTWFDVAVNQPPCVHGGEAFGSLFRNHLRHTHWKQRLTAKQAGKRFTDESFSDEVGEAVNGLGEIEHIQFRGC